MRFEWMALMMMMVTQHIPTRWESDIMIKGGNMTQSNSHHTHILMFGETLDNSTLICKIKNSMNYAAYVFSQNISNYIWCRDGNHCKRCSYFLFETQLSISQNMLLCSSEPYMHSSTQPTYIAHDNIHRLVTCLLAEPAWQNRKGMESSLLFNSFDINLHCNGFHNLSVSCKISCLYIYVRLKSVCKRLL